MLNLIGLPLAETYIFSCSTIKLKVEHEMPVYRLNCVSEGSFESMYFILRLCMNI